MKKIAILAILLVFCLVGMVQAQTAKDAIEVLQKLVARTETGISPRDYTPLLGEANTIIKPYLNNPEADKNPRLKESIKKTWHHFLTVKDIWDMQREMIGWGSPNWITPGQGAPGISNKFITILVTDYPELSQKRSSDGSLRYDDAVGMAWTYADRELNFAIKLQSLQPVRK
jgi:hypothetical protein